MPNKIINAVGAIVAIYLLGAQTALAAPMLCSGEEKTCIAACQKGPRGLLGNCLTSCRARFNYCRQTGCWDDGKTRYCGLLRR